MVERNRRNPTSSEQQVARIFVGTSANGEDAEACAALEYSIRKNASGPIEITWMALSRDPKSPFASTPEAGWRTERWSTPWTGFRWAVPELCAFAGRAIYFDCATIVRGDVHELLRVDLGHAVVALRSTPTSLTLSCMVWDCAAAGPHLPPLPTLAADNGAHQSLGTLLANHRALIAPLPRGWAASDSDYEVNAAAASGSVHFPSLYTQPHARHALSRLARSGRQHWFTEPRLEHFSPALIRLSDDALSGALTSGARIEDYEPREPYGSYSIQGADRVQVP